MQRSRYGISLIALMSFVLALALGLAALRSGSELVSQAVFSLLLFALATATAGAVFAHGPLRAFCGGGAIFGWQSLAVLLILPYLDPTSVRTPAWVAAKAVAIVLHPYAESATAPKSVLNGDSYYDVERKVYGYDAGNRVRNTERTFVYLMNLLYAALGGLITMALAARKSQGIPRDQGATSVIHRA